MTVTTHASTRSTPQSSRFGDTAVSIQDANHSLQLILSHHGNPALPLVVTHLDPSHSHLIATLPLHSHSHSHSHATPHHGPPPPATVAAVANATTALLPIFLHSPSSPQPSTSVPPPTHPQSQAPPTSMIPWSCVSFDHLGAPHASSQPAAWLLQAHGSLQSIGRRHAHPRGAAAAATALASVDVFLVDALGKHPAQLLVSSRVPAAALPVPPLVGGGGAGSERGWVVGSKM